MKEFLFQFHKGSIKTMKVGYTRYSVNEFQFHKGSIKTKSFAKDLAPFSKFQFHKGSIKTQLPPGHAPHSSSISIP